MRIVAIIENTCLLVSTVEILIMHIVIMHNSHNALSFRGSRVGIRGKWVNIAYCIMHGVSGSIMHYEDTLVSTPIILYLG